MADIILPSRAEDEPRRLICSHCEAVFTFTKEDVAEEDDRGVRYQLIKCPACLRTNSR